MQITVSAAGKIILIGEHAVVYGKPALLAAVDRRVRVTLKTGEDQRSKTKDQKHIAKLKKGIKIIDKNLNIEEDTSLEEIMEFTKRAGERWEEFNKTRDPSILKSITEEPLALVKLGIGEVLLNYELRIKNYEEFGSFTFEINSEIPVGRGMGSSAAVAVAVAVAGSMLYFCHSGRSESGDPESTWIPDPQHRSVRGRQARNDKMLNLDLIYKIALEAEKRVHGNPSGADTAIATYGGLLWYRKETEDLRIVQPITCDQKVFENFTVVDTGKPLETTGEMVTMAGKKIRARKRWGKEILSTMEEATKLFYGSLEDSKGKGLKEAIFSYERCLEKLGVVSESTKAFIRKLKDFGIAAKVSGAGGRKGNSGMVVCFGDKNIVADIAKRSGYEVVAVEFGGEGIQINF